MPSNNFRIIFMGTPEFAVASLKAIVEEGYSVVAVVTAPDKPAGRGQKLQEPEVKKYAVEAGIPVLQPEKLKDQDFIETLKSYHADLQVVVAFRMLPEVVWSMPRLGTINLHASILPHYRGAAPINWVVINGETATGATTFFIEKEIDTGKIIYTDEVSIGPDENAGSVHDKLMDTGAKLLVKTVKAIEADNYPQTDQNRLLKPGEEIKQAPKIFKDDCRVDWNEPADKIHNKIRGLSPYPTAWSVFENIQTGEKLTFKIFESKKETTHHTLPAGTILTDEKRFLKVAVPGGFIHILLLQIEGKKKLPVEEVLKGFRVKEYVVK